MENAAVEFLQENLKHLQLYQAHLISDHTKNQITILEKNLCLFKRFLKNATTNSDLEKLGRQIGEVVYQAEDAVDAVASLAAEEELESYFKRSFDAPAKLLGMVQQVELIAAEVEKIYDQKRIDDFVTLQIEAPSNTHTERKNQEQNKLKSLWLLLWLFPGFLKDNVVGIEDQADMIINSLMEETEELGIISIVGVGGLGKTTLARKVFRHPKIEYEFPIRLWVNVSEGYRIKDIFLGILRDLSWITDDINYKTVEETAQTLHVRLEKEKFLIVLDDLWAREAWDALQAAFPKSNNKSKILITCRFGDVLYYANGYRHPHQLRFLTKDESWKLLLSEAFGVREITANQEKLGKCITKKCSGVPFMIKVIAGILKKAVSEDEINRIKNILTRLYQKPGLNEFMSIGIQLSYNMLPYHLRPCFLYLQLFPEDFAIPVRRLLLLWIAEGFIQVKPGVSLEETAEEYLEDLIDRNLVMIDKVSTTGRIKTCRIHDFIRDFCLSKAREYLFLELQHSDEEGVSETSSSELQKYRRVSIHSDVLRFISSQPYSPYVRTFLHSSQDETIELPAEHVPSIPDAFNLLRVLEAKPIIFTRFPFYLTQLVHLRYITLFSDFKVLPEEISGMWNLQTLVVYTRSHILKIKADIWKMIQLRHLQSNASIILAKSTGEACTTNTCENIQTLANISPESCTEVFERATNLKKLGIRGRLASLIDDMCGSSPFDGLQKLGRLEKLTLLNDATEIKLRDLPPANKFPPNLMSLTLSYTSLSWKHMSILGLLENLKMLKLKNGAFMGERWEAADQNGFLQLQVLQVEFSDLVVWEASHGHFPKLQYLKLRNCEELEELPFSLVDVLSLRETYLYRTTKSAAASAKKIRDAIQQTPGSRLELSVFPLEDQA